MIDIGLTRVSRVLCLGAHSDDIEIGCGGTVLKIIRHNPKVEIFWQVFSAEGKRKREARQSAREFLGGTNVRGIGIDKFRESYFPNQWASVKDTFEALKQRFNPDLILTHYRHDRHQDHAVISDLTWNTFRDHFILEYEIPKYDGDLGQPNVFVALPEDICNQKISTILRHFQTQASRHWFTQESFLGILRIRGIESATRYAEAYYCRKLILL